MREAQAIVDGECSKFGITIADFWKSGRTRSYAQLRRTIIYRLRTETKLSWSEIALLVGLKARPNKQFRKEAAVRKV